MLVEEVNYSDVQGSYYRQESPTPHEALERTEQEALLENALRALSPAHRQVITLFYFEGYSHQHIAARLDISVAAVKSLLHRARAYLRKEIEHYGR